MGRVNLPQSFFHCPELSRKEKAYLIQKAQDSAKALVEGARSSNGPIRWTEAGSHNGAQMYKGEARNPSVTGGEEVSYLCGATSMQATLEECAEFFDISTTAKMKDFAATQDDIHDGVVLYTLAEPSPANNFMHQITVKWFLGSMMNPIKDRDFLTLECQDVFTDTTGRRGWVRSYHSIKLPCCPDLQKDMGFIRGSCYHSGYVFVESERPGYLDCIYSLQVNLKGNVYLPQALYFAMMKRRIGTVGSLGRVLHERRLGKQKFLSDLELVPKNQRSRCQLCAVRFGVLTRKARCRKCGEVVCHQCTQIWDINVPKFGAKKVRVCAKCCSSSSREALETMTATTDRQSVSMASEHAHTQDSLYGAPEPPRSSNDPYGPRRRPSYEQVPNAYRSRSFVSEPEYGQPVPSPYYHDAPPNEYGNPGNSNQSTTPEGYPLYHHGTTPPRDPRYYNAEGYLDPPPGQRAYGGAYAPGPQRPIIQANTASMHNNKEKLRRTGMTEETASLSSEFSESHGYEDRGLNPALLEQHTRQMGRPGPVYQSPYHQNQPRGGYARPPAPQGYAPYAQGYPVAPRGAPQGYAGDGWAQRPMHQPEYNGSGHAGYAHPSRRVSYGSDHNNNNSEVYREFHQYPQGHVPPPPPPAAAPHRAPSPYHQPPPQYPPRSHEVRSKSSGHSHHDDVSSDSDDSQLDREIARPRNGLPPQHKPPPPQPAQPTRSHMGLSFGSDSQTYNDAVEATNDEETGDAFDEESLYSPVSRAIADDFSTLLRPTEEHRMTTDSYRFSVTSSMMEPTMSFCDTIHDYSARSNEYEPEAEDDTTKGTTTQPPRKHSAGSADGSGPTTSSSTASSGSSSTASTGKDKKVSVVQLYQQILELTKQQHALDTSPEADVKQKDKVANDLRALYQQLNELTMNPEIEI